MTTTRHATLKIAKPAAAAIACAMLGLPNLAAAQAPNPSVDHHA